MKVVGVLFLQLVFCWTVWPLPCLTNKSKQDFEKTRSALKSLESFLKGQVSTITDKIKGLDNDMTKMEEDFKLKQWRKHNNHCYYFGTDKVIWTEAERRCREIGGYLTKIDDSAENIFVFTEMKKTVPGWTFWIGMTDVVNGDWRWTYDQTQPSYTNWHSGRPHPTNSSYSKDYNCIYIYPNNGKWYDYKCSYMRPYICESNFCFS